MKALRRMVRSQPLALVPGRDCRQERDALSMVSCVTASALGLVGRRPDAPLVFADAGRRAARYSVRAHGRSARTLARVSPSGLRPRISRRAAARLARQIFGGDLRARPQGSEVRMSSPLSLLAFPAGAPCAFYGP